MDCNTTEAIRILAKLAESFSDNSDEDSAAAVLKIIDKIVDDSRAGGIDHGEVAKS